jgi:hypothetical protein
MEQLNFETVPAGQVAGVVTDEQTVERARVPGGWIVIYDQHRRVKFCPDTGLEESTGLPPQRDPNLRLVA